MVQKTIPLIKKTLAGFAATFAISVGLVPASQAAIVQDDQCAVRVASKMPMVKWQDDEVAPRGCVVLAHGLTQRGMCLQTIGKEIASKGYIVFAIDERGHGFWHFGQDKKADGYIADWKRSSDDLAVVLKTIREQYPYLPTFCVGESAGSAIIARAAVKEPDSVDGLVLCSAGIKNCRPNFKWAFQDLAMHSWRPKHAFNIVRYQRRYGSDNPKDFTDQEMDPFVRRAMSPIELMRVNRMVHGTAKVAKNLDPRIPILVIEGTKDQVLRPDSARKIIANARSNRKELVMIDGCGHVMLGTNYPKPLVISSIERFLDRESSTQAVARANTGVLQ